jgi:hypothetical protein
MKPSMLASLVASMLAASAGACTMANESPDAVVKCEGANDCKGQGACGGVNADGGLHGCEGQNSCKGQGWIELSNADCAKRGGKVIR